MTVGKAPIRGPLRSRPIVRDAFSGIRPPAVKRAGRRAGVKRLSKSVNQEAREALRAFIATLLKHALSYTEYSRRVTVTTDDLKHALKHQGLTLYGI